MKVVLATPPKAKGRDFERYYPNLGLLYLISYARRALPDIEFAYFEGRDYYSKDYVNKVAALSPDVFGITLVTLQEKTALGAINEIKKSEPSLPVICGGPHVTALPKDFLAKSNADVAVIGEGEVTFTELLRLLQSEGAGGISLKESLSNISGLMFRKEGELVSTGSRAFIRHLDTIPFPAWDCVDVSKYSGYIWQQTRPDIAIISSRGCPYNCTFCANPVWKSNKPWLRMRSPKNVAAEIQLLYSEYGIREVFDISDEFNVAHNWALKTCQEISRLNLPNLHFKCQLRAHKVSDELAKGLRDIGCWLAQIGMESGNQETLDGVKKFITIEQVVTACRQLKNHGIKVLGYFMIGNLWEANGQLRYEDARMCSNTLKFAKELVAEKLLNYLTWSVATPVPGSELFEICRKYELLTDFNSFQCDTDHIAFSHPGLDQASLRRLKWQGMILQARCALSQKQVNWRNPALLANKVKILLENLVLRR